MIHTIVPEIIKSKNIHFYDERDIEINLCEEADSNFVNPFETPFLIVNRFAEKTTNQVSIVPIDIIELKKLDYVITVIKGSRGYFRSQKVTYRLEHKLNIPPFSKKITYIPTNHKLQKDIPNKRIRLVGPNAGPNGFGPWNEIK
jgi:hypothetical protein